ncbi:MAG TPA: IPT/TIG domain-containing protein [Pantanalinema sp.]
MRKLSLSLTLVTLLALGGCAGTPTASLTGGATATGTTTTVAAPVISSFSPTQGTAGTVVTVTGTGFDGAIASNNLVLFNGTPGLVTAATATTLTVIVPEGGSYGTITVTVNGKTATSADSYSARLGIRTVAGSQGAPGGVRAADWRASYGAMAMDSAGNLYVTQQSRSAVYKIDPAGTLTTVAGTGAWGYIGDGFPATVAQLNSPEGLAVDASGNLYIADTWNHVIRKVSNGVISTVAGNGQSGFSGDGGPAGSAQLYAPRGLAVDATGDLYIADTNNNRIRKVDHATGIITTFAGTGSYGFSGDATAAVGAQLAYPHGVAVDASGSLYIADTNNSRIRKVSDGTISTVGSQLAYPQGVTVDGAGNLYVADTNSHRIRKLSDGTLSIVAGNGQGGFSGDGGTATSAQLSYPKGVVVDAAGNLYVADTNNFRIRKLDAVAQTISTVAGDVSGEAMTAGALNVDLAGPAATAEDAQGNLYIADRYNHRVRKLGIDGTLTTVAGTGVPGEAGDSGVATSAQLNQPQSVAVDAAGNLYIADTNNNRIRMVPATDGTYFGIPMVANSLYTFAGTGVSGFSGDGAAAGSAQLNAPLGVAADAAGDLYIADTNNNRIRKVDHTTGFIATVAGTGVYGFTGDGAATSAQLNHPQGLAVDAAGNLYIADTYNNRIRKLSGGSISTVAGNGYSYGLSDYRVAGYSGGEVASRITLDSPEGVAVDAEGNLYVADTENNRILKVALGGAVSTVAGNGIYGIDGDGGLAINARLASPRGVTVGKAGNLFIADTDNNLIRSVGF